MQTRLAADNTPLEALEPGEVRRWLADRFTARCLIKTANPVDNTLGIKEAVRVSAVDWNAFLVFGDGRLALGTDQDFFFLGLILVFAGRLGCSFNQ